MASTTSRPCPGCLSASATAAGVAHGFDIRACTRCGTLFGARPPMGGQAKDYDSFYREGRNVAVPEFVLGRLEETKRTGRIVKRVANAALSASGLGDTLKVVAERGA